MIEEIILNYYLDTLTESVLCVKNPQKTAQTNFVVNNFRFPIFSAWIVGHFQAARLKLHLYAKGAISKHIRPIILCNMNVITAADGQVLRWIGIEIRQKTKLNCKTWSYNFLLK